MPEEAAFNHGFISLDGLRELIARLPGCEYRSYLESLL